ncbi:MAG: SDR family oxidoreductase [Candidatus Hodarchaeota archaeon]
MKSVLVIGANGFLGSNFLRLNIEKEIQSKNLFFIAADLYNKNIDKYIPFYFIDITNPEDCFKKIIKIDPDIILLTAALTDVDKNETEKDLATKINTEGPKNVLKACEKINSKLIFMSSDFVFDGTKKKGLYTEDDIPNPICHYGKTKYDAELALLKSNIDYLICRTAVLYGWNKNKLNFITWVLDKLDRQEKISIVANQTNNATFVRNLAEIIIKLIEKNAKGIYHTAGDGTLSRYEMALKCAEIFNYNKDLIYPIDNLNQIAIRPKNTGLDISKLKKLLASDLKIYSLEDGLKYMREFRI